MVDRTDVEEGNDKNEVFKIWMKKKHGKVLEKSFDNVPRRIM